MSGRALSGIAGLFLFVICVSLLGSERGLSLLAAALVHEAAHVAAACALGAPVRFAGSGAAGLTLRFDFSGVSHLREAAVCLAGPVSGLLLFGIPAAFGRVTYLTVTALALALFNLIPASFLDGGAALSALLSLFLPPDTVWRVTGTVSVLCTAAVWAGAVVLVFACGADISSVIAALYLVIRTTE